MQPYKPCEGQLRAHIGTPALSPPMTPAFPTPVMTSHGENQIKILIPENHTIK